MTFDEYETAAVSTAVYPSQGTPLGLMYCALKLNGEAGELAEHIGKAMRDDNFSRPLLEQTEQGVTLVQDLTTERRELILKEVGDCQWYLAAIARELGTSLSEIAQANIDKLAKRKAEGKLGGSGDLR